MVNVTITITETLDEKLRKYSRLNKSELFRECVENRLAIIERAERLGLDIPPEVVSKLAGIIESQSAVKSFEFGRDIFLEWITI